MYYFILLKYFHRNFNNFERYIHKYRTKNMNSLRLSEPKCKTNAAFYHSMSQGPRLLNKFYSNIISTTNPLQINTKI